jgi:antitoxin component of RelBE/YafQ-DinJ toxin-antitoxin module
MAQSRALHVRLDADSEAALGVLRAEGMSSSEAVRLALVEASGARRRHAALREEAVRLAADAKDRRELAALASELDDLTPTWPED